MYVMGDINVAPGVSMNNKDKEMLKELKKKRNSDPKTWDVETFTSLKFEDYIKSSVKEANKRKKIESEQKSQKVSIRLPKNYLDKINAEKKGRGLGTKIKSIIDRDESSQALIARQIAPLKELIAKLSIIGNEAGEVNSEVIAICKKISILQGVLSYRLDVIESYFTPNEIYLLSAAVKISRAHEA